MKTTLDHLPERKQRDLHTITTILRDTLEDFLVGKNGSKSAFRILKIILFGSHAKGTWVCDKPNGYVSDYDILVIVNKAALAEEDLVWHRAEEQIDRRVTSAPLGLIVHDIKDINQRLHEGQYFFKDIRAEGIEIFASTPKPLAQPGNLTIEEQRGIAQKYFDQWLKSANGFLDHFLFSLEKNDEKISAFMLHQTTERLLACTLLVCTNYLPKSHDIEKLGKLCAQIDLTFADIFPMDSKFHRRSFQRLKRAYIDSRYSEHFEITVEELEYLQGEVEKLKSLTESVCQGKIDRLASE